VFQLTVLTECNKLFTFTVDKTSNPTCIIRHLYSKDFSYTIQILDDRLNFYDGNRQYPNSRILP
jgi:hypothetical protein